MKKEIINYTIKFIVGCVTGIVLGYGLIALIDNRIRVNEQVECQRWQQQAIDYANAGYYLTDWQFEQCEAVGYPVKVAPVVPRKDFEYLK